MNDKLESIDGIEDLKVTRTGKCSGYKYSVRFLTLQGDAPLMTVSVNSLIEDCVTICFTFLSSRFRFCNDRYQISRV